MSGDGGQWLRRQCLVLSQNSHTPISYWLSVPLRELVAWIEASNRIVKETRELRERNRPKPRPYHPPKKPSRRRR